MASSGALLLLVLAGGCIGSPAAPTHVGTSQEPCLHEPPTEVVEGELARLIETQACDEGKARPRHPGSPGLDAVVGDVQQWAERNGYRHVVEWYGMDDRIPPQAEPWPPATRDDIRDLRVPVLRIWIGDGEAPMRLVLATSVETPLGSPYETEERLRRLQTPGADLAASAMAVLMVALDGDLELPDDVQIELQVHGGSFSYKYWAGLSSQSFLRRDGDSLDGAAAVVGLQQLATCEAPVRRYPGTSEEVFEKISKLNGAEGLQFVSEAYFPAADNDVDNFTYAAHPGIIYAKHAPAVLLSHGFWDNLGTVGRTTDNLGNACLSVAAEWVKVVRAIVQTPNAWVPTEGS